jgi:Tat protein translocase TatB subunit
MFGLSFFEILAIVAVALLVFGPEKLPEIAKVLGKFSGELKKTSDAVRREFYNSIYPPAEELQSTYRKLTTSPLAQLEGTCEEITKLPDSGKEATGQQSSESKGEHNDSGTTSSSQADYNTTSALNIIPGQTEDTNSIARKISDSCQTKSEESKGE